MESESIYTFEEFCAFSDNWRQQFGKKQRGKFRKRLLYFRFLFGVAIVRAIFDSSKSYKPYRNSDKYKKVIKEGVFLNRTEYHER